MSWRVGNPKLDDLVSTNLYSPDQYFRFLLGISLYEELFPRPLRDLLRHSYKMNQTVANTVCSILFDTFGSLTLVRFHFTQCASGRSDQLARLYRVWSRPHAIFRASSKGSDYFSKFIRKSGFY